MLTKSDEDPKYASGFELGQLFERMSRGRRRTIRDSFLIENQEQIFLLANRLRWEVVEWYPWFHLVEQDPGSLAPVQWFYCHLRKPFTTPETHPAAFPCPQTD